MCVCPTPGWVAPTGRAVTVISAGGADAAHEQAAALKAFPDRPVEAHKAWKEMVHRYFAGTLGLLVALIAVIAWRQRRILRQSRRHCRPALLVVIAFQAALGMWTVTLLLAGHRQRTSARCYDDAGLVDRPAIASACNARPLPASAGLRSTRCRHCW